MSDRPPSREEYTTSSLYTAGMEYLTGVLEELVPDGAFEISMEPGDYINATEDELAAIPDTDEGWQEFFTRAELSFKVNFWDFGIDLHELCEALLARQISGRMAADDYSIPGTCGCWTPHRAHGTFTRNPAYKLRKGGNCDVLSELRSGAAGWQRVL